MFVSTAISAGNENFKRNWGLTLEHWVVSSSFHWSCTRIHIHIFSWRNNKSYRREGDILVMLWWWSQSCLEKRIGILSLVLITHFLLFSFCIIHCARPKNCTQPTVRLPTLQLGRDKSKFETLWNVFYYINTNEIPGELSRESLISSHVKISPLLWLHNKSRPSY